MDRATWLATAMSPRRNRMHTISRAASSIASGERLKSGIQG
jgi:hypothetical protein